MRRRFIALAVLFLVVLGCQKPAAQLAPPKPPVVTAVPAVTQQVTDFEEFTGRTEASETVEVRAQVTGYLDRVFLIESDKPIPMNSKDKYVREGSDINKDDLLFQIDPKLLQAEVERAEANVASARARAERLQDDFDRFKKLPPNSVSPTEVGKVEGDLKEARAAVKSAEAAFNSAKVNREYCNVRSPIAGRVARRLIDPGNTVKASETALTYVARLDPMYVFFDVDERSYLRLLRAFLEKGMTPDQLRTFTVEIGLADEQEKHPRKGHLNFVDTRVDPNTGSVWVRAVVLNSDKFLTPGLFVRVRMPVSDPHDAVLVPERALGTDQGKKFIYVVNEKSEAEYRPIEVGAQHGQMREILKGAVKAGEKVIDSGLQRVRAGGKVELKVPEDKPAADKK